MHGLLNALIPLKINKQVLKFKSFMISFREFLMRPSAKQRNIQIKKDLEESLNIRKQDNLQFKNFIFSA